VASRQGDVLETAGEAGQLDLLTLPAAESAGLLRPLWRYEITRHHLMPTLSNAAQAFSYARALFPHLRTECFG